MILEGSTQRIKEGGFKDHRSVTVGGTGQYYDTMSMSRAISFAYSRSSPPSTIYYTMLIIIIIMWSRGTLYSFSVAADSPLPPFPLAFCR